MFHVVIPARFGASRLPGKPLLPIGGRPLIQWVWERACASGAASVIVATDDARVLAAAEGFGADCLMTSPGHASGTDRVAEVVRVRGFTAEQIVVNVQGDEPFIEPELVARVAEALRVRPYFDLATAVAPIQSQHEFLDANCVKAVRGLDGRALYFSRAPVPWPRDSAPLGRPSRWDGAWRHIGIYAYRVRGLQQLAALPPTPLEKTESLEQLRALEHGMSIHLLELEHSPAGGVDTPEDLARVRSSLQTP
jgi:3-deoxy-manno-octulosonate cytidylyltransferase (CMP-KDO synthetase)